MRGNQTRRGAGRKIIAALLMLFLLWPVAGVTETAEKEILGTLAGDVSACAVRAAPMTDYTVHLLQTTEDSLIADLRTEDENLPGMNLAIVRGGSWPEAAALDDLSGEDLQRLRDSFLVENDDPVFTEIEAATGEKLLQVTTAGGDAAFLYTIRQGLEIEIRLTRGAGEDGITEADLRRAVDILESLEISDIQ